MPGMLRVARRGSVVAGVGVGVGGDGDSGRVRVGVDPVSDGTADEAGPRSGPTASATSDRPTGSLAPHPPSTNAAPLTNAPSRHTPTRSGYASGQVGSGSEPVDFRSSPRQVRSTACPPES